MLVKNRVKWPHEYVLSSLNKERVTYDQLNVTQWVAGFGRTMRDESDPALQKHMLEYLISIMDDANDFSWTSAKASHAVLLCRMEQGEVKDYSDTLAIDRIRVQMHKNMCPIPKLLLRHTLVLAKSTQKLQNPCLALIITKALVYRQNLMRQGGYCTSTFVLQVLQPLAVHFRIRKLIAKVRINNCQKTISNGWAQTEVHPWL